MDKGKGSIVLVADAEENLERGIFDSGVASNGRPEVVVRSVNRLQNRSCLLGGGHSVTP
jgi:hypothetical protein